ncbi:hypothetical protein KDH_11540 [Dictyobacter sp. S3.2.2.5]|uniref:Uncharacterized protein n=2 Tax=Dictyobacter halimunensis TaxID=3026934 RepID=A0ABQ6FM31_9CHLR|nr:hypothetical protein KDH_11540 [Dictyobacter sp. S3.2.2.5]
MVTLDQDQFTITVTSTFITQYAPEELPLLPGIVEVFQHNPEKFLKKQNEGGEDLLGFGPAEVATLLTPVVLLVTDAVITAIAEKSAASLVDRIVERVKKLFGTHRKKIIQVPDLSKEQLTWIHEQAYSKARTYNLSDNRAMQLADSIIAGLVTSQPPKKP